MSQSIDVPLTQLIAQSSKGFCHLFGANMAISKGSVRTLFMSGKRWLVFKRRNQTRGENRSQIGFRANVTQKVLVSIERGVARP